MPDRFSGQDAIARKMKDDLNDFLGFLGDQNVKGLIGEFGWQHALNADWAKWNALMDWWLRQIENYDLPWFYYGMSYRTGTLYPIVPYRSATLTTTFSPLVQALVLEKHMRSGLSPVKGISVTGAQLWPIAEYGGGSSYYGHATVPGSASTGILNTDYSYEPAGTYTYLASRGFTHVRIITRWERLQKALGATLDAAETAALVASINAAGAAGLQVLVDIHNFGGYCLFSGLTFTTTPAITANAAPQTIPVSATPADLIVNGVISIDSAGNQEFVKVTAFVAGTSITGIFTKSHTAGMTCTIAGVPRLIGSAQVTQANFVDFWTKMSTLLKANANVWAYSIMNEPQGISSANWQTYSQAIVNAIRGNADTKLLAIPGTNFSVGIDKIFTTANGRTNWITDSANNFRYELHYYPDALDGGQFLKSYSEYNLLAARKGY